MREMDRLFRSPLPPDRFYLPTMSPCRDTSSLLVHRLGVPVPPRLRLQFPPDPLNLTDRRLGSFEISHWTTSRYTGLGSGPGADPRYLIAILTVPKGYLED
jgi:hypothetical protein